MVKTILALAVGQTAAFWGPKPVASPSASCKWLPWGAWAECRGVCGSGVQTRVRRCLGGIAGSCCQGRTLDSKGCDQPKDDTCSYWSGWGQWSQPSSTCGTAQRCKLRTCYGRDSDHCHGPTELCEPYVNADPPTLTKCENCANTCCPHDNPDCCVKSCYTYNQCTSERTVLPVEPCENTNLPCCPEWSLPSEWSPITQSCFTATRTRHRHDMCNPKLREYLPPTTHDLGEGNWGPFVVSNQRCSCNNAGQNKCDAPSSTQEGCSGKLLVQANGQAYHQCPGFAHSTRDHSCYSRNLHKTDIAGQPLKWDSCSQCGSDAPTVMTEWDKTDAQCAKYCQESGVFKTRYEIQPCREQGDPARIVNREMAPCWGPQPDPPFGPWTACDATCGGKQWRWKIDPCRIDPKTGKKAVIYEVQACTNSGPAVGEDTWSAFGPWSTCPATYPAACVDYTMSQTRSSACGVKNPTTGAVEYRQTSTATCAKPVIPAAITTEGPCSATCTDSKVLQSVKRRTTTQVCVPDVVEYIQCAVPECCKPIDDNVWSDCDCDRKQYRVQRNTCSYIEDIKIYRSGCLAPLEPYQPFSEWSTCSNPTCPSLGRISRYACTKCERNVNSNCANVRWEFDACPGVDPTASYEGPCNASCNQPGTKTVFEQNTCTKEKFNERQVECTRAIAPAQSWFKMGSCVHTRNNVNCPGVQALKKPAWIDPNTRQVCAPEESATEACGPLVNPPAVPTQWTSCVAPLCVQTRSTYDQCTMAAPFVESRPCELGYGPMSSWSACNPIILGVNRQHICLGSQTRRAKDLCQRMPDSIDTAQDCGLQVVLADLPRLTEQTFFTNDPRYLTEPRDSQNQPLWSPCPATCDADPPILEGIQMITRKPICEIWPVETLTKTCKIESCLKCGAPQFGDWGVCSSKCTLGHQHRQRFRVCTEGKRSWNEQLNDESPWRDILPGPVTKSCGAQRAEQINYTSCTSVNQCANGVYCGQGSRQKIVTAVSVMDTCPAAEVSVEIYRAQEPCPLVRCPVWGLYYGQPCGGCDLSRTLVRTCEKDAGAESCECSAGPTSVTDTCVQDACRPWSAYSSCSVSCGIGTQSRSRWCCSPLGGEVEEVDVAQCRGTGPDEWMSIQPGIVPTLVPLTPEAGWSYCDSSQCVPGQQQRTLKHACTGEEKSDTPRSCLPALNPNGGSWLSWSAWTACTETCQPQMTTRQRSHACLMLNPNPQTETASCPAPVSVAGGFSAWSACPLCYASSDQLQTLTSQRSQQWSCNGYGTRFDVTNGVETEITRCNIPACARWSTWVYTPCTCNSRQFGSRSRTCVGENLALGIRCDGPTTEPVACNDQPIYPATDDNNMLRSGVLNIVGWELVVSAFSEWTQCGLVCSPTGFCGKSTRSQDTLCRDDSGTYLEFTKAEETACPCETPKPTGVIVWTECDSPDEYTCPGTQTGYEGYTCGDSRTIPHYRPCGTAGRWLEYGAYGDCSASCNGGTQVRSRAWSCIHDNKANEQSPLKKCNEHFCNYYGAWSNWGACSVSCGLGTMTRTRYCHGGNDGTGLCKNDGQSPCENLLSANPSRAVGKLDCARCDMGKCCEWDWSGWTGCCADTSTRNRQPTNNIRLRFRGNQCGQNWEVLSKACEIQPIADSRQPFPTCDSIKNKNFLVSQSGSSATWLGFINPDKTNTAVLQGTKLGHVDDPNTVQDASHILASSGSSAFQPSTSGMFFTRNEVAFNSQPMIMSAPAVPLGPSHTMSVPASVMAAAAAASAPAVAYVPAMAPAPVYNPAPVAAVANTMTKVNDTTPNNMFGFLWNRPSYNLNSNANTQMNMGTHG